MTMYSCTESKINLIPYTNCTPSEQARASETVAEKFSLSRRYKDISFRGASP